MGITVVGTVAFDAIQTPFGKVDKCIGGSGTYFSVAASFFTDVALVGVVGDDFTEEEASIFKGRRINLDGLQRVKGEKTFFWSGEYGFDLNVAKTRDTQLNAFAGFQPKLSEAQREPDVLFLANIYPELQYDVLKQAKRPRIVALDTMNLWIETKRAELERVIREVDPTGAGDTFAGGFLGYLASRSELHDREFRRAIVFGSVLASFTVEKFSLDRLREVTLAEVQHRYREFRALTHFEDFEV